MRVDLPSVWSPAVRSVAITGILCLPWLWPATFGPSAAVVPWLVAMGCAGCLMVLYGVEKRLMPHGARADWNFCIARAWVVAGLLSCGAALVQYTGQSRLFEPWINPTEAGVAFANLRQRNQFATLTVMALAAFLWTARQGENRAPRPWHYAVVVLLALGNAASSSRTGLVEVFVVAGLLMLWRGNKRQWRLLLIYMLAFVASLWWLPLAIGLDPGLHGAWARMQAGDKLCASRWTLWSNVLDLIAVHPWVGWGWGRLDLAHYLTLYPGARFCDILDNAHNLPLHLAVELGVPAALALMGVIGWGIVRGRPWSERDATRQLAWTVLALIGLHSLLEYPLWYGPFQIAVVLCLALLGVFRRVGSTALMAVALILGTACAYAGWDYHRISQIYLAPAQRSGVYKDDTMRKIKSSWLFRDQVRFAELTTTPLTPANAARLEVMALDLLRFSPEPRVIQVLIEAASLQGHDALAHYHTLRFQAAFPEAYDRWRESATQLPAR